MQKINLNPKLSPAARKYITRLAKKELKRGKKLIAALGMAYRKAKEKGFKLPAAKKNPKLTRFVKTGRTLPAYEQFRQKIKKQLLKRGHSETEAEKGAEDIAKMYMHHFDERVEEPYKKNDHKNDLYMHAPRGDNRNPGPGRNIDQGFYDSRGSFHPIRASRDYDEERSWSGALSRERKQIEREARQSMRGSKPKTPLVKTKQRAPLLHSQREDFARKMYDARMAKRNPSEAQQIAQTILDQIKALDRSALGAWAARGFTALAEKGPYLGGVYFRVSGRKFQGIVMVQLHGGRDTYDVSFIRGRKTTLKVEDIYVEELMQLIDSKVEGHEKYLKEKNPVTFDHVSKIADVVASLARMGSRNPGGTISRYYKLLTKPPGAKHFNDSGWIYLYKDAVRDKVYFESRGWEVRIVPMEEAKQNSGPLMLSKRGSMTQNIRRVKAEMRNVGGLIREKNTMAAPPPELVERLIESIEQQYPLMSPTQKEQILRFTLKNRGYGEYSRYDALFPRQQITFPERKPRRRNSAVLSAAAKEYVSRAIKRAKPKNAKERGKALAAAMKRAKQKYGVINKNDRHGAGTDRSNINVGSNPHGSVQTKQVQPNGIVRIYNKVEEVRMSGNRSPGIQKHEKFYHPFKGGSVIDGLPKGTNVKAPNGERLALASNSVLIRSTQKKPLWGKFVTVK